MLYQLSHAHLENNYLGYCRHTIGHSCPLPGPTPPTGHAQLFLLDIASQVQIQPTSPGQFTFRGQFGIRFDLLERRFICRTTSR